MVGIGGWVWVAFAALVQAQAPVPNPYAAIGGIVLNNVTGEPVRHAMVTLSTLDNPPREAVTFTGSDGAFGFNTVPPGRYRLYVERDGFQQAWFGASTPNRPPAVLKLAAGDVRSGITFRLRPLASVTGTVLDADGDPLAGAEIRLLKAGYDRRKPSYTTAGRAASDQRGHYRLVGVLPGTYTVMASQTSSLPAPEFTAGQATPVKVYAAQYYPETDRLSAATPIQFTAGKDLEDIDFHLPARFAATLHGRVHMPADASAEARVEIAVTAQDVPGVAPQRTRTAKAPDYAFTMDLLPGPYLIVARLVDSGQDYQAAERIELSAGGREINLQLEHGIELSGRIDVEGGGGLREPFRVTVTPRDALNIGPLQAEARADGTFTLPGLIPGAWDVGVEPIPPGGYLKGMWLGKEDVLTGEMVIAPSNRAQLRIVVSTRGGGVSGTVTTPGAAPKLGRAFVLLAPAGKNAQMPAFDAVQYADDAGHFEFEGIRPGRYRIYAFEEMDPQALSDPVFLKPFEPLSEPFEVTEGGRISKETPLITAGAAPAARN